MNKSIKTVLAALCLLALASTRPASAQESPEDPHGLRGFWYIQAENGRFLTVDAQSGVVRADALFSGQGQAAKFYFAPRHFPQEDKNFLYSIKVATSNKYLKNILEERTPEFSTIKAMPPAPNGTIADFERKVDKMGVDFSGVVHVRIGAARRLSNAIHIKPARDFSVYWQNMPEPTHWATFRLHRAPAPDAPPAKSAAPAPVPSPSPAATPAKSSSAAPAAPAVPAVPSPSPSPRP